MAKARKITGVSPMQRYHESARIILPQRLEEVYTWEPFIRDEARREELHNMRISIKRLRYTLELFRSVYGGATVDNRYAEFLAVIVDLQEILGDIHDADVVLAVLADYTSQSEDQGRQMSVPPGIAALIAQTKGTRKSDYETFLKRWDRLSTTGFKQELLSVIGCR